MKKAMNCRLIFRLLYLFLIVCQLLSMAATSAYASEELSRGRLCILIVEHLQLSTDNVPETSPFLDLSVDDTNYAAYMACYQAGIVSGVSSTQFRADGTITRAQVAKVLCYCYMGAPNAVPETIPADVRSTAWFYQYVCSVLASEAMSTDSEGYFRPNETAQESDINWNVKPEFWIIDKGSEPLRFDLSVDSINIYQNPFGNMRYQQGNETYATTGQIIIQQTNSGFPTSNSIKLSGGSAKLTLSDLNVEVTQDAILTLGKLTLNLIGTNTFVANKGCCIRLSGSKSELLIEGGGKLNATVEETNLGSVAAIGTSGKETCGNVTINNVSVNIQVPQTAIGAAYEASCGNICINNSHVTATSNAEKNLATIGSNLSSQCGKISIDNSTVSCSLIGSDAYSSCGEITITNSTLSAEYIGSSSDYNYDNGYGSDSVTIENVEYKGSKPKTYELIHYEAQLPDTAAHVGNVPALSATATGHSGLSFQWQVSSNGSSWTDVSGQTGATFNSPMTAAKSGSYYRCKITNGWGNTVYTDAARVFVLAFNKQPQSVLTDLDELASLSVEPSCANVTYQWERSYDGGETWTTVPGEVFSTLLVNATLSENSALYRCVITATNGDSLTSDAAEIKINVRGLVTYTTRYYLEKADGSGYDLAAQNVLEGTEGQTVTAAEKTFEFYTEEKDKAVASGTVKKDGSLVLARYYARQTFTMSFDTDGGTIMSPTRLRFGAEIPELTDPTKAGYVFEGWYADEELSEPFTLKTMPTENIVIYAKWKLVGDGRGIEYKINGIVLRDAEYKEITEIPRGKFFAEVSVTNLSSKTIDVVILATYNAQGQMTKMNYLFANPQIGQTFALGTRLDNSKGDIASIKAFVVPILGGLVPLADAVELG